MNDNLEILDLRKMMISDHLHKEKAYRMHISEFRLHLNCALDSPCLFTQGVQKQICSVVHVSQQIMKTKF